MDDLDPHILNYSDILNKSSHNLINRSSVDNFGFLIALKHHKMELFITFSGYSIENSFFRKLFLIHMVYISDL